MRTGPFAILVSLAALLAAPAVAWAEDGATRFVHVAPAPLPTGIAAYGPFRVIDSQRVALVDVTDERSPAQFAAMLQAFPHLAVIEMLDCPGTYDDEANLRLGRMIRAAHLATHVPNGGSVRSGAVELFLAGAQRMADDGAEFAVHAWEDEDGAEATNYASDAAENRKYLIYYQEMGMDASTAQAFYAMTNSVPFDDARWFGAGEMRHWLGQADVPATDRHAPAATVPALAYLDLAAGVN